MAIPSFVKILPASILLLACTAQQPIETGAPTTSEPLVTLAQGRCGEAVVEFDDALAVQIEDALASGGVQTKSAPLDAVLQGLGAEALERVFPDAGEFEPRTRRAGLHRFYHVTYSAAQPLTKALTDLSSVPGVVSVRPVRPVRRRSFNDPLFQRQWHYVNTRTPGADINIQPVWDSYTKGSEQVIVSVVDEGVWGGHPDLADNMWDDGSGHYGYNFIDRNYQIFTDLGHGTHVAGVIGAVNNNGVGVAGIAGGDAAAGIPGVRIMSCVIFQDDDVASDYQSAAAIKWGADHGAVISNNSWGYYADGILGDDPDGFVSDEELRVFKQYSIDPVYKEAIDYFIRYAGCDNEGNQLPDSPMKGGLVFFAAGNEAIDYDIISSYEPVISVGAFNEYGSRASYSNYGDYVDLATPGGEGRQAAGSIWSTVPLDVNTSGYAGVTWCGTSMACPHAAGVAALLVSYFGGEGFTQEDCRRMLLEGSGEIIGGSKPIGRKLDADAVFAYGFAVMREKDPDAKIPPVITLSQKSVTLHAHEQTLISVSAKDVYPGNVSVSCTPGSDALVFHPATGEAVITGKNAPAGTYQAVFVAQSAATGLTSQAVLEYTLLPNHAPEIVSAPESRLLTSLEDQVDMELSTLFRDIDGETLRYVVSVQGDAVQSLQSGSRLTLAPKKNGIVTISISAVDALEASVSVMFQVAVRASSAPMVVYPVPAVTVVYFWPDSLAPETIRISIYAPTGAKVKTVEASGSAFEPLAVDIAFLSPAKYTAVLEYGGKKETVVIVKI